MSTKSIIPLVFLVAILTISSSYVFGILSANHDSVNVTGTEYEQAYNTNVQIQSATASILSPVSMILGVVILLLVVGMIKTAVRR